MTQAWTRGIKTQLNGKIIPLATLLHKLRHSSGLTSACLQYLHLRAVGSGQDIIGSDQGASAESIDLLQMEDETDHPGELLFLRWSSTPDESIVLINVAGQETPQNWEVQQECRRLPNRSDLSPHDWSNIGLDSGKGGHCGQDNCDHFHLHG